MGRKKQVDVELLDTRSALETLEQPSDHVNRLGREEAAKRVRPERRFKAGAGKLSVPAIPGFRTYWANLPTLDYDMEYNLLIDRGYEPVLRKEIEPGVEALDPSLANSKVVISTGKDTRGILLKIPTEWWEADQAEFVAENNRKVNNQVAGAEHIADMYKADGSLQAIKASVSVNTHYGKI